LPIQLESSVFMIPSKAIGLTSEQLIAKYQAVQVLNRKSLEGLNAVNWSVLHHAFGDANDIPILLQAVLSDDKDERKLAFILLRETIWHQGTVYEASAYTVPFLLKMLASPETQDKISIALLLALLATGDSYLEVNAYFDKNSEEAWRNILAKDGLELETETAKEIKWVNDTRKEIDKGLHLLYPYLKEAASASYIAWALACYPEHAIETLPILANALATASDKYVVEEIQAAINKLTKVKTKMP
jgi:hypothetical protein